MYLSYMTLHCTKISIINQTLTECRIKVFQTKLSCIPDDYPTFLSKNNKKLKNKKFRERVTAANFGLPFGGAPLQKYVL